MSEGPEAPQLHQRVREILEVVLDAPLADRAALIDSLCGDDHAVRRELESLLEHIDDRAIRFTAALPQLNEAVKAIAEAAATEHDGRLPERIAEYRITGLLGEGGMGIVYLGEQESPRREVAIKVVRSAFAGQQILRRFRREAEVLGTLRHPNIAQIYSAGTGALTWSPDPHGVSHAPQMVPYFAMEYVRGVPITEFCRRRRMTSTERVRLLLPICEALEHAHAQGVVHRDLKPANILVEEVEETTVAASERDPASRSPRAETGRPRILDFGIARRDGGSDAPGATIQTEAGQVIGTLPYMSPEQVSGLPSAVDRRSDVYALGVILYELLVDRLPLELAPHSIAESVRMVTEQEPTPLGVLDRSLRGDLDTIVSKCLEKDPGRRYRSAAELGADLRRHLEDRPIEAKPPTTIDQVRKFARRHRGLVAGVAVAFVALVTSTIVATVMALRAVEARDDATERLREAELQGERSTQSYLVLEEIISQISPPVAGAPEPTIREVLDRARGRLESLEATAPEVLGMLLGSVARAYQRLGDPATAEELFASSVRNVRATPSSSQRAPYLFIESLIGHGEVLHALGRAAEARASREAAIALLEQARAWASERAIHSDQATANYKLGELRSANGDVEGAATNFAAAIVHYEAMTQPDPGRAPFIATLRVHVGGLLMALGRPLEAEQELRRAIPVLEAHRGPDDQQTVNARANLVTAINQAGRFEEALPLAESIVATRRRLEPGSGATVTAELNHAFSLLGAGRPSEAAVLMGPIIEWRRAALGDTSPDVARARVILAEAHRHLGRLDEAESLAVSALEAHRNAYGPAHVRLTEDLVELAEIRSAQGRFEDALRAADEARASIETFAPNGHPMQARCVRERARALVALGRLVEAVDAEREMLDLSLRLLSDDHPQRAECFLVAGGIALRQGDAARALRFCDEARGILVRSIPGATWRLAEVDALRGAALQASGDAVQGAALVEEATGTIGAALGSDAPALRRARSFHQPG